MPTLQTRSNSMNSSWIKRAKCRGLPQDQAKDFYAFDKEAIERAKALCAICPVKKECVISVGDSNAIAGGMTKLERLLKMWHTVDNEQESNFS